MSVPTDERELVAACLRNDRRAQEAFYRRYAPPALAACRRYARGAAEATELLNGGMTKVFAKLHTFRWEGSLEGWVKRLVFRSVIDQVRADRRAPTLELANWDAPTPGGAPDALYAEDLCRLIDRLPVTCREVFWLFAVEGYSHAEIGAKLHLSENNSRWHLAQARKKLRRQLSREALQPNRYAG